MIRVASQNTVEPNRDEWHQWSRGHGASQLMRGRSVSQEEQMTGPQRGGTITVADRDAPKSSSAATSARIASSLLHQSPWMAPDQHSELNGLRDPFTDLAPAASRLRPSLNQSSLAPESVHTTDLSSIPKEPHKRRQSQVEGIAGHASEQAKVLKLSPAKIQELTSAPESLPVHAEPSGTRSSEKLQAVTIDGSLAGHPSTAVTSSVSPYDGPNGNLQASKRCCLDHSQVAQINTLQGTPALLRESFESNIRSPSTALRPQAAARSASTPSTARSPRAHADPDARQSSRGSKATPRVFDFSAGKLRFDPLLADTDLPSPMPSAIPVPPPSIPTYLQLELSSHRPSPLYIHRSATSDFPYESSGVKIERLLNFIFLPLHLESALWFGTLACFDTWLYTFTILPLRVFKSFYILGKSWATNLASEAQYVSGFVYQGTGRVWRRRYSRRNSLVDPKLNGTSNAASSEKSQTADKNISEEQQRKHDMSRPETRLSASNNEPFSKNYRKHGRAKSIPSALLPDNKADMLKGALIICTCFLLMRLDASRMYHWIRGQAAIKLYVIYNVLEVCDRLFSAIGQDVLECLFSREALERKPDGHSKILRPFWLFILALFYVVIHATALFHQVITLNVAVNSYSNALITLLISNQFVEIKSTVFKKFEKENLFQLTCADVVERFQLWLMLTIIASRNIVETGGLSMGFNALTSPSPALTSPAPTNSSNPLTKAMPPRSSTSILPSSFELVPTLFNSLTAYAPTVSHVMGPFLVVLGSEMLVDWLKHAYINKFNNTRPQIYGRFLDVLAKDYYSNAFGDQNLTKRLGLPVIPLSCLFIRAGVQTYQMFVAAWIPAPVPSSATGLTNVHEHYTASGTSAPTSTAVALSHKIDDLLRQIPTSISSSTIYQNLTTILVCLLIFLVLLAVKLVLGMVLLSFARSRYRSMKERENNPIHHVEGGRRVGGWGVVEVDDDKRRWIYEDDADGVRALKEREARERAKQQKGTGEGAFDTVKRYEMASKRIW